MTVRSQDIQQGIDDLRKAEEYLSATKTKPRPYRKVNLAPAGIAALMFGIPLWLVSARYSLDGWRLGINVAAHHIGLPIEIPVITGWYSLLLIPIGLIYSFVEVHYNPFRQFRKGHIIPALIFLIMWGFIHGTDLGSTFLSAITLEPDAWTISQWLAHTLIAVIVWSVILTYLPERLILLGISWLKQKE